MSRNRILWTAFGLLVAGSASAQIQPSVDSLTAERVVMLARARAPQVRIAESAVLEARGRLAGARSLGRENPTIEGVAAIDDRFEQRTQWELTVPVGIGIGYAGRVGVAQAEVERERQLLADARRGAVGAALAAYYRVQHASRRVELARERLAVAVDLRGTALDRHRAGQVPRLEVLLTETEEVRAESELLAEEELLARERIGLAAALGEPSGEHLQLAGDPEEWSFIQRTLDGSAPVRRADVMAADREVEAAKAAWNLARGELLPGLAFRLNYGHENGEPLVQPGLAVTVPIFQHGQENRALARARGDRARVELERVENSAASEAEGLAKAFQLAGRAVDSLAARAMPRVTEAENMVRESYRAGKIDLPALLVVRRDLLDTRREYLDRLLNAALTGIDLAVARGCFQQ
jgi:cobalt-zinc-cadmium efflux system outer membrane protein